MIASVDDGVDAFHLVPSTVLVLQSELHVLVDALLQLFHETIEANDRLVVLGAGEPSRAREAPTRVIDGALVRQCGVTLFAYVRASFGERCLLPVNMGDVSRSHGARKPQIVVVIHNLLQVGSGWHHHPRRVEVSRETRRELVEKLLDCLFAHGRHLGDVIEVVAPTQDVETSQHLQQQQGSVR